MPSEIPDGFASELAHILRTANEKLLNLRVDGGYWEGELSSSALSTATAVCSLALTARHGSGNSSALLDQANAGLEWIAKHQNSDGGWGDTTISLSNISTTALCWAAFGAIPGANEKFQSSILRGERWLTEKAGSIQPESLAPAIIRRYGKDRTFSVPILTMCALAGRLGSGREAWRWVLPLPFELAAFPHKFYAALRLPVVSYALPALIAIGQARHFHLPSLNPITRFLRIILRSRTLRILQSIQPSSGGFLEATPLTSFVVMSLASSGNADHPVTKQGIRFLLQSVRQDGSWPIDTNLATWVTTLSVNALSIDPSAPADPTFPVDPVEPASLRTDEKQRIHEWLLKQQYLQVHPYTNAPPGAWAWTDLPGGVPDADDTAGALLALLNLGEVNDRARAAAARGLSWLVDLQNRDGGIPTFCRGWGALPFDRSSPDLTAHAIRAWLAWIKHCPRDLRAKLRKAIRRASIYLCNTQRPDGSWIPLWFGNQFAADDENPTYGTSRVLCALTEILRVTTDDTRSFEAKDAHKTEQMVAATASNGTRWLLSAQHMNGSWGGVNEGTASIEETALAVEALASALEQRTGQTADITQIQRSAKNGAAWLVDQMKNGMELNPSPIGFYFARLWYYEKLYPLIFSVGALNRTYRWLRR